MTKFETQELQTLFTETWVRFSKDQNGVGTYDNIYWNMDDLLWLNPQLLSENGSEDEKPNTLEKILEDVQRRLWPGYTQQIQQVWSFHNRFFVFYLQDWSQILYDITKHEENNLYIEWDLETLIHDSVEKFTLSWWSFQDHLQAMQVLFEKNEEEWFAWWYLDEDDILHAHIIDDRISENLRGEPILKIQQAARENYREICKTMSELPIRSLPQETQNEIAYSIDRYTRMIMWIGDIYEGGATHLDKSRSEVEFWISFAVESKASPEEVIYHWKNVYADMDSNNWQDTTIENTSYPFFIQILNRHCYQKLLDLNAPKEDLLLFTRLISGRTEDGIDRGSYGPNHYDPWLANVILWNLLGMPAEKKRDNEQGWNILETLITHDVIEDIRDPELLFPEDLSLLPARLEEVCKRVWLAYPWYLQKNFPWRAISQISGTYKEKSLWEKVRISALSRFVRYIEQSLQETPDKESYEQALLENAQSVYQNMQGSYLGPNTFLDYQSWSTYYTLITQNGYSHEQTTLKIPISRVQDKATLHLCIHQLRMHLNEWSIYFDIHTGRYMSKNNDPKYENINSSVMDENQLFSLLWIEPYGNKKDRLNPVPAPSLRPEYIAQIQKISVFEAYDHISDTIMGKFDWYDSASENEFINVNNDSSFKKNGKTILSKSEIEILQTWADINGLGDIMELSDENQAHAITWAKIAVIISLSMTATAATAGAAWSVWANTVAGLLRGWSFAWQVTQWGTMWFYAAPISWGVYPHGYSSREEMIIDLLSDLWVSTLTWVVGWAFSAKFAGPQTSMSRNLAVNGADFAILWIFTEAKRMQLIQEAYHPWENFLDSKELK